MWCLESTKRRCIKPHPFLRERGFSLDTVTLLEAQFTVSCLNRYNKYTLKAQTTTYKRTINLQLVCTTWKRSRGQNAHYRDTVSYFVRKVRHYPSCPPCIGNYNSVALTQQSIFYVLNSIAVLCEKHFFINLAKCSRTPLLFVFIRFLNFNILGRV